jgi:uncharacterized membrane protein YgdD (TMEM256/DUF423 family)
MRLTTQLLGMIAGLLGAAGVGAAALAAHGGYGESLGIASQFALIHATLAIALLNRASSIARIAAGLVLLGALLFCGDLSLRALAGHALAPMAAPTGGFLMIAGWITSGIATLQQIRKT